MNLKTALTLLMVPTILLAGGLSYAFLKPAGQGSDKPGPNGPAAPATPAVDPRDLSELVNASNRFALEMYAELADPSDNLFFSPYSIFTALGMTYEGARGQTADEIRAVFHFPADDQTRWSLFKALIEKLNANDTGCDLSTANAMWIQQDFNILADYVSTVRTYYKAEAVNVDYIKAAEAARLRINGWVENQTNGKIKDLIPNGILDSETRLVLTNAIYFKGAWLQAFNESLTKEMDFHPDASRTVTASMMVREDDESKFNYTEVDGVQILKMPYSGEKLSMLVLLPKSGTVSSLEKMLTPTKLTEWRGGLTLQRVDVYFPRFKLETKYFLADNLSHMGMPSAFTSAADFSGIDGKQDLLISAVIHQAFVSVDEKGTEAAAATAVVMELGAIIEPTVPVFMADHPFIFLIQDDETGNILFMGKVVDPTG
jgi:serine protease inhibitor